MLLMGIDIGGTKIEVALIQCDPASPTHFVYLSKQKRAFSILARKRTDTERTLGYHHFLQKTARLCQEVLQEAGITLDQISAIGMGLPGSVDPKSLRMANGNSGMLNHQDVKEDLKNLIHYSCPIQVANDANCFVLAEALAGAGVEHLTQNPEASSANISSLGIILGTGVGGGIIFNSQLIWGRRGAAGEWGHSVLVPGGLPCFCGNEGCAEVYLSGPGFEAAYNRLGKPQEHLSAKGIFALGQKRDPQAMAAILQYKRQLAFFLGMLAQNLDPDYIVLGGGMSNAEEIYVGLEDAMTKFLFVKDHPPKIYKNRLGDSAGVLGAAFLNLL